MPPKVACPYWRHVFGAVVQCQREAHGDDETGHVARHEDEEGVFEIRFQDPPEGGA